MPSSAFNTTPVYKPTENRRSFFSGKRGKLLLLLSLVLIAGGLALFTLRNSNNLQQFFNNENDQNAGNLVDEETGALTDENINNISDITIEDVKEASESSGINPLDSYSISDEETSKKIYQEIGNDQPENHIIGYNEFGLSEPYITIKQGDTVTWMNGSTEPMSVVGEGWDSVIPRDPDDIFTYGFIYLGEYPYKINDTVEGIVNVEKN